MIDSSRYKPGNYYDFFARELNAHQSHPRKVFHKESLEELKASIIEHGVLQPVIVTEDNGQLIVVAGVRRVRAAQEAGLERIPAKFVGFYNPELPLIENLHREDLSAVERAEALQLLKNADEHDLESLAKIIGKSVSTVSEILSITRLPDDVRDECRGDSRYAQRKLVEIARADTQQEMKALFGAYKDELEEKVKVQKVGPRNKTNPYDRVVNHVASATKSLRTANVDEIGADRLKHLTTIIQELERLIEEKLSSLERL